MALDIRAWVYVTDQTRNYQLGVANYIALQGGATPHIGSAEQVAGQNLDRLPSGMKPRVAKVFNAGNGKARTVVCMAPDAPLFQGTVGTINLTDGAGVSAAYTWTGTTGERSRNRNVGV
jgi:hypothetical protein